MSETNMALRPVNIARTKAQLESYIQELVMLLTGLEKHLVRRETNEEPINSPNLDETWCSFMIISTTTPSFTAGQKKVSDDLYVTFIQETVSINFRFTGPLGWDIACAFRDMLQIAQNRRLLRKIEDIGVIDCAMEINETVELINTFYVSKSEFNMTVVRSVEREYNILNLDRIMLKLISDIETRTIEAKKS